MGTLRLSAERRRLFSFVSSRKSQGEAESRGPQVEGERSPSLPQSSRSRGRKFGRARIGERTETRRERVADGSKKQKRRCLFTGQNKEEMKREGTEAEKRRARRRATKTATHRWHFPGGGSPGECSLATRTGMRGRDRLAKNRTQNRKAEKRGKGERCATAEAERVISWRIGHA